jgi:hypothetical protein
MVRIAVHIQWYVKSEVLKVMKIHIVKEKPIIFIVTSYLNRVVIFLLLTLCSLVDNEDEMCRACTTNGGGEKCK